MTQEEVFENERKAFKKFLENKTREQAIALISDCVAHMEGLETDQLIAEVSFN